jgi:hypothetical protein
MACDWFYIRLEILMASWGEIAKPVTTHHLYEFSTGEKDPKMITAAGYPAA